MSTHERAYYIGGPRDGEVTAAGDRALVEHRSPSGRYVCVGSKKDTSGVRELLYVWDSSVRTAVEET